MKRLKKKSLRPLLEKAKQSVRFFLKEQDTIEKKIFWSIVPLTILAGFVSLLGAIVEQFGFFPCATAVFCMVGPAVLAVKCRRTHDCEKCFLEFCYLFNCLLMPLTFLANGGLYSGMPGYCIGSLILCSFCTNKHKRSVCFIVCTIVYIFVFFASYFFPFITIPIREDFIWFDVIISFAVSSVCLRLVIGTAIEEYNTQRYSEVNNGLIDSLGAVIEFRSLETGNHVKNIKNFTRIMLEHANKTMPGVHYSKQDIAMISSASVLHDIGKIAVPDNILQKPGRLTAEEYAIIKHHPEDGCKMIETLKDYQNPVYYDYCYEICRHHHERYNGSGYPDGLSGEDIPLISQIVGLADVYEALTGKRVYKEAYNLDRAKDIILNGSAGQYSERVIKCFINALPELEECVKHEKTIPPPVFEHTPATKIGICMKDADEMHTVNGILLRHLEKNGLHSTIELFDNPDALLNACRTAPYLLILLGVENKVFSNIDVAKEIQAYNPSVKFIFVSDDVSDALKAFELNTVDYRVRPLTEDDVNASLNKAFKKGLDKNDKSIVLKNKNKLLMLSPNDIILSMTEGHNQVIQTTLGEALRFKKTSAELYEYLESYGCFARCGASYILNMSHIVSFNGTRVIMSNKEELTIPRRVHSQLLEQYRNYYRYKEKY